MKEPVAKFTLRVPRSLMSRLEKQATADRKSVQKFIIERLRQAAPKQGDRA